MKELLLVAIFGVLFQGYKAESCRKSTYSSYSYRYYTTYIHCDYGCCGTYDSRYCCSESSSLSAGTVAAIVIVSILGFISLATITILIIAKGCTKSGSRGQVIQPAQYPAQNQMIAPSRGSQSTAQPYPPSQSGMSAPPYCGQVMSHPPGPPINTIPGQPQPLAPSNTG